MYLSLNFLDKRRKHVTLPIHIQFSAVQHNLLQTLFSSFWVIFIHSIVFKVRHPTYIGKRLRLMICNRNFIILNAMIIAPIITFSFPIFFMQNHLSRITSYKSPQWDKFYNTGQYRNNQFKEIGIWEFGNIIIWWLISMILTRYMGLPLKLPKETNKHMH